MGVYVYCLGLEDLPRPARVAGVDGLPVTALDRSGFRAWVSPMERPPGATLDRVRAHNAVVEAACGRRTPLPFRYGQWFRGEDELDAALERRRPALEASLARIRDAVEFGVRILDPRGEPDALPQPPPARSRGTAYLEALARRERHAEEGRRRGEAVAAELRGTLGDLVRDERVRAGAEGTLVAIAHLVGRHDTGNYSARLRAFTPGHPGLRLAVTGPWPPYGFAE